LGTKDILVNGEGALIAKEEVGDFADKVLKIIFDPEFQQILSLEAREYVYTWRPDVMTKRMINLYQNQLSSKTCLSAPYHAS